MKLIKDQKLIRTGTHTDANGQETTLTRDDLQEMVDSFNPEYHQPFVAVGHSSDPLVAEGKTDQAPSFGWLKNIKVQGEFLLGDLEVIDQVYSWLKEGLYKFKSLAFYPREMDINPSPGKLTIRHLAILGGAPPAIKGLGAILNFNEKDTNEMGVKKVKLNKEDELEMKTELETEVSTNKEADNVEALAETGCDTCDDKNETSSNAVIPEPLGAFEEVSDDEDITPFNPEPELSAEELSTLTDEDADLATLNDEETAEDLVSNNEDDSSERNDDDDDDGIGEFLDDNIEELYRFILKDGPKGYQGEITRFVPIPTDENSFLFDTETAVISGNFIDESSASLDEFTFEIRREGDGWVATYSPVVGDPGPDLDEAEIEDELATDPETNEQVSEFGEGCGCQDKNPLQLTNVANGGLDMPPVSYVPAPEDKLQAQIDALSAKLRVLETTMMKDLMDIAYEENRILPSQLGEDMLKGFAEQLTKVGSSQLFSFGEKKDVTLLEMFTEIVRSLPVQVEMGEIEVEPVENTVDSQAIIGYSEFTATPEDGEATHRAIVAYCENNGLKMNDHRDYIQALKAVTRQAES